MNTQLDDEFAHDDAAYVLGALSTTERAEFERHLTGCTDCARRVRELAGMPGLLARIDEDTLADPALTDPVPDTLLPALVREVRRAQRRRTLLAAGIAAAAALVVGIAAVGITRSLDNDSPAAAPPTASPSSSSAPTQAPAQAMSPLGDDSVTGSLALTGVAWGTKLELTCSYDSGADDWGADSDATYAMFVRTREGHVEQVATWRGLPGKTMHLGAATATTRDDIASVVVRTSDGKPVLRIAG